MERYIFRNSVCMEKMVEVLVSQHDELRTLLGQMEQCALHSDEYAQIVNLQEAFLKKLEGHLSLENGFFYPKILEGMKRKDTPSEQIDKTKLFISKMKEIEVQTIQFFDTYKTAAEIGANKESYVHDLKDIMSTLVMRIESEEEGVYIMWDFFGEKE